jgi:hypothetical protein
VSFSVYLAQWIPQSSTAWASSSTTENPRIGEWKVCEVFIFPRPINRESRLEIAQTNDVIAMAANIYSTVERFSSAYQQILPSDSSEVCREVCAIEKVNNNPSDHNMIHTTTSVLNTLKRRQRVGERVKRRKKLNATRNRLSVEREQLFCVHWLNLIAALK